MQRASLKLNLIPLPPSFSPSFPCFSLLLAREASHLFDKYQNFFNRKWVLLANYKAFIPQPPQQDLNDNTSTQRTAVIRSTFHCQSCAKVCSTYQPLTSSYSCYQSLNFFPNEEPQCGCIPSLPHHVDQTQYQENRPIDSKAHGGVIVATQPKLYQVGHSNERDGKGLRLPYFLGGL